MGPFPAGVGAKAPWPPPLDPPLISWYVLHQNVTFLGERSHVHCKCVSSLITEI